MDDEYVSSDESQSTLVEERELSYTTSSTDDYQCCLEFVEESRLVEASCLNLSEVMKSNHPKVNESNMHLVEGDSSQRREQVCPNVSEIIDLERRYFSCIIMQYPLKVFFSQA